MLLTQPLSSYQLRLMALTRMFLSVSLLQSRLFEPLLL
jgi:hypothetical protein